MGRVGWLSCACVCMRTRDGCCQVDCASVSCGWAACVAMKGCGISPAGQPASRAAACADPLSTVTFFARLTALRCELVRHQSQLQQRQRIGLRNNSTQTHCIACEHARGIVGPLPPLIRRLSLTSCASRLPLIGSLIEPQQRQQSAGDEQRNQTD